LKEILIENSLIVRNDWWNVNDWNVNFEKFFYYLKKNLCTRDNIREILMHAQNLKLGEYLCITDSF